ncbi:SDR family oxidoreductase [Actinoplanes sp. NPDC051343]|uniref:SDR family oxidoreductase n=1 Tax=Actinoplanes sp. NPDC051343 TaxID=3363906 RepID=UPI0037B6C214
MGDSLQQLASMGPAGRPASPDEIAAAITFLAGDAASFVHGAILPADGGRIAVRSARRFSAGAGSGPGRGRPPAPAGRSRRSSRR